MSQNVAINVNIMTVAVNMIAMRSYVELIGS